MTEQTKPTCHFCGTTTDTQYFYLYKFVLQTNRATSEMGLLAIFEQMNKWILDKMFYLSASEIILMRPDLVNDFLGWYKPDEVVKSWYFTNFAICTKCYETYKTKVPER